MTFHFLILIALTPDKPLMFMYQNVYMFICLFDHMFNYICKCMFKFLHQKKTNLLYKIGNFKQFLLFLQIQIHNTDLEYKIEIF